jgi:NADH:ubiquinone oxidoreductase subunit 5 (subunit L)/multisubunit Na+/H+ antiporter MnhA subunit
MYYIYILTVAVSWIGAVIAAYFSSMYAVRTYTNSISKKPHSSEAEFATPPKKPEDEAELSLEAQKKVRKYIMDLVAVPAVALSIAIFFLGFFTNKVAFGDAYKEAYASASSDILKLAENATESATKAKQANEESAKARDNVKDAADTLTNLVHKDMQVVIDTILSKSEFKHQLVETLGHETFFTAELQNYIRKDTPYWIVSQEKKNLGLTVHLDAQKNNEEHTGEETIIEEERNAGHKNWMFSEPK